MTVKEFVNGFNSQAPNWTSLPPGFPKCDLAGLTPPEIGGFNAILTYWQLAHPQRGEAETREWQDPTGYRFLPAWSNGVLLRILIRKFTDSLPLLGRPGHLSESYVGSSEFNRNRVGGPVPSEHRLKAQMDDAARSFVANIEEGFKRPTTHEFLEFIGFAEGSLEEVKGDVKRARQDGFLKSVPGSSLAGLGIDLKEWQLWCQNPNNEVNLLDFPLSDFYVNLSESKATSNHLRSLNDLKGTELTFEIFIELINKTDWLARQLVIGLEKKLDEEGKHWQVEQMRINRRIK